MRISHQREEEPIKARNVDWLTNNLCLVIKDLAARIFRLTNLSCYVCNISLIQQKKKKRNKKIGNYFELCHLSRQGILVLTASQLLQYKNIQLILVLHHLGTHVGYISPKHGDFRTILEGGFSAPMRLWFLSMCCTGINKHARCQGKKNEAAQQFSPYFVPVIAWKSHWPILPDSQFLHRTC